LLIFTIFLMRYIQLFTWKINIFNYLYEKLLITLYKKRKMGRLCLVNHFVYIIIFALFWDDIFKIFRIPVISWTGFKFGANKICRRIRRILHHLFWNPTLCKFWRPVWNIFLSNISNVKRLILIIWNLFRIWKCAKVWVTS